MEASIGDTAWIHVCRFSISSDIPSVCCTSDCFQSAPKAACSRADTLPPLGVLLLPGRFSDCVTSGDEETDNAVVVLKAPFKALATSARLGMIIMRCQGPLRPVCQELC